MEQTTNIDELIINSIRMLGVQAVNKAKSGHPGIVLGAAPMAYALFKNHLKFNPKNPFWFNRDRFILSAGHGSALLYSMLYHAGYNYTMDDLKAFRQLNSNTPGHPEYHLDYGVEMATGPLGQGIASAVGMALAESFLATKYNQENIKIIDHYTYTICGDGDLQEGIAQEALSFAGHFKLNKLIVLYDSNDVQLDSKVNLVFSENLQLRMESLQWNYLKVTDGENFAKISAAISEAKASDKPTLIEVKTIIGFGATKQATSAVHGSPLMDDIKVVAKNLNWEYPDFTVPKLVNEKFKNMMLVKGETSETLWNNSVKKYAKDYPKMYQEISKQLNNKIFDLNLDLAKIDWKTIIGIKPQATRDDSSKILKLLSAHCPTLIGGSADLAGSTKAMVYDQDYLATNHGGRHIHYGVREFAMAAIVNGMTLHQGLIAFGSTFLVFSDYLKPALRLSALMKIPALFIFSHDSIAVGEDGPTHQPIEQLAMLRTIPNFNVIRPADTRETIGAYLIALRATNYPNAVILTRQNLPQLKDSDINLVANGAYVISKENTNKPLDLAIIATGSEVALALAVQEKLMSKTKINTRVISMPSMFLFEKQDQAYRERIIPNNVIKVAIELGVPDNWYKYINGNGFVVGINEFGTSAPEAAVLEKYGFTTAQVYDKIIKFLEQGGKK